VLRKNYNLFSRTSFTQLHNSQTPSISQSHMAKTDYETYFGSTMKKIISYLLVQLLKQPSN